MTDKANHVGDHPIVENPERRNISRANKDIGKQQKQEGEDHKSGKTGSEQSSSS